MIGIGRNITALKETEAELKRARENLHFKVTHDSLDVAAVIGRLSWRCSGRELRVAPANTLATAVLLADLDHFKTVNDRFGHPVGDEVLRETAKRFLRAVRTYDLVGRLGGGIFCDPWRLWPAGSIGARGSAAPKRGEAPMATAVGPSH